MTFPSFVSKKTGSALLIVPEIERTLLGSHAQPLHSFPRVGFFEPVVQPVEVTDELIFSVGPPRLNAAVECDTQSAAIETASGRVAGLSALSSTHVSPQSRHDGTASVSRSAGDSRTSGFQGRIHRATQGATQKPLRTRAGSQRPSLLVFGRHLSRDSRARASRHPLPEHQLREIRGAELFLQADDPRVRHPHQHQQPQHARRRGRGEKGKRVSSAVHRGFLHFRIGVNLEDTWVRITERALNRSGEGSHRFLNAGGRASAAAPAYEYLVSKGVSLGPEAVILQVFIGNDFYDLLGFEEKVPVSQTQGQDWRAAGSGTSSLSGCS